MNQTICIAYRPGAYGSFLSWAIDRFSLVRRRYLPSIVDDPLLPDGSSHSYASHCKVETPDQFMQGLENARNTATLWHYSIFAGWPGNINQSVPKIREWMLGFDRLIVVEATTPEQHMLCYLRNEATMDKSRWYGMLGIENGEQLLDRLRKDASEEAFDRSLIGGDPRVSVISIDEILNSDPHDLFRRIGGMVSWPMCDENLFVPTLTRMRQMQGSYLGKIQTLRKGGGATPAEKAIERYFKGENKWI